MTTATAHGLRSAGFLAAAIASAVACVYACVEAAVWALRTFGAIPLACTAGIFVGAVLTHGIDRALEQRRHPRLRRR